MSLHSFTFLLTLVFVSVNSVPEIKPENYQEFKAQVQEHFLDYQLTEFAQDIKTQGKDVRPYFSYLYLFLKQSQDKNQETSNLLASLDLDHFITLTGEDIIVKRTLVTKTFDDIRENLSFSSHVVHFANQWIQMRLEKMDMNPTKTNLIAIGVDLVAVEELIDAFYDKIDNEMDDLENITPFIERVKNGNVAQILGKFNYIIIQNEIVVEKILKMTN